MQILPPSSMVTLTDANSSLIQHGNFRCETNRCIVWKDHMKEGDTLISHSNNTSHWIRNNITCSTFNVLYLFSCRVYGIQCVVETMTSLKRRVATLQWSQIYSQYQEVRHSCRPPILTSPAILSVTWSYSIES